MIYLNSNLRNFFYFSQGLSAKHHTLMRKRVRTAVINILNLFIFDKT